MQHQRFQRFDFFFFIQPCTTQSLLLKKKLFGKHYGKTSIFFPFPIIFCSLPKIIFNFSVIFILLSANAFNLEQPRSLRFVKELTHYHTMLHFHALKIYSCGKHCEKRRNCLLQAISPFLTFSILYGIYFSFYWNFKMSPAMCFNLDQSKILSSGNGLTHSHTMTPFDTPGKQAF